MSGSSSKSSLKAAAELARRNKSSPLRVADEVFELEMIIKQIFELKVKNIQGLSASRSDTEERYDQEPVSVTMEERQAFLNPNPDTQINQQNRDCAHEIMKTNLETLINEYRSRLDRFLIINAGPPLEESAFQNFHNDTSLQLLNKYDHLDKPGNLACQSGYREVLEEPFIAMYAVARAHHKKQAEPKPTKLCKVILLVLLLVALITTGILLAMSYIPKLMSNENSITKTEFHLDVTLKTSTFVSTKADFQTTTAITSVRLLSTEEPSTTTEQGKKNKGIIDELIKPFGILVAPFN